MADTSYSKQSILVDFLLANTFRYERLREVLK